ncbi:MAG: radical SAM protein [Elusimicrobia bacterium]|nr:radical SAM protein [Elusimicrobiota bacterium]
MIRDLYRRLLPESWREKVSRLREQGRLLLNYALLRSIPGARAWPNTLVIEGTNICNARCAFCAYPRMKRPKATMSLSLFRSAVDQYLELGETDVDLTPIAGDPLVDKHLLERLDYLHAHPRRPRFHFYTNAILLTSQKRERLLAYGERFRLFCSLAAFDRDAYRQVMGVDKFDEVVANLRALIEAKAASGSRAGVQVCVRPARGGAAGELWDYLQEMRDKGVVTLEVISHFDNWGGLISAAELENSGRPAIPAPLHHGPCHRLLTGPVVLADGRVAACCCRDLEATLIIGDLKTRSLRDILSGPELKEYLARQARGDFPDVCKVCTRYGPVYPWFGGPSGSGG